MKLAKSSATTTLSSTASSPVTNFRVNSRVGDGISSTTLSQSTSGNLKDEAPAQSAGCGGLFGLRSGHADVPLPTTSEARTGDSEISKMPTANNSATGAQTSSDRRDSNRRASDRGASENREGKRSKLYKLIDFGTAVGVQDKDGERMEMMMTTTEIQFAGTPAYSSPESFNDVKSVSYPTDLWSLSVTLFHLTSGQLPFDAPTSMAASISIAGDLDAPPPDVRDAAPEEMRANISSGFAAVIARGMQKRVEHRFATADEMSTALYGCLVSRGETVYSAFISYRVFSEKYHALALYEALNNTTTPGGHRVIVYLDVKRLVKGEDWEEGFASGLLNSLVALPMLSAGVIGPMTKLTGSPEDRPDNVAKELIIMQAILAAKQRDSYAKLCAIYPILVGRPCGHDEPHYPCTGNFFSDGSAAGLRELPNKVSPATMDAVAAFLQKQQIRVEQKALETPLATTVKDLFALQGAQLWAHQARKGGKALCPFVSGSLSLSLSPSPPRTLSLSLSLSFSYTLSLSLSLSLSLPLPPSLARSIARRPDSLSPSPSPSPALSLPSLPSSPCPSSFFLYISVLLPHCPCHQLSRARCGRA